MILLLFIASLNGVNSRPFFSCGSPDSQGSRIINGVNAKGGAWPWQVLLKYNENPICGGAIINPLWIVTASHCLLQLESVKKLSVVVGATNFLEKETSRLSFRVGVAITHPNFSISHLQNDVALLRLEKPLLFNNYIRPVCLPSLPASVESKCIVTGWGRKSRERGSPMYHILQQVEMPIVDIKKCSQAMSLHAPFNITSASLCAGYGNATHSACHGDSGGPFVCRLKNRWELHGVVSWGSENCSELPDQYSVFANLFELKEWIIETISDEKNV